MKKIKVVTSFSRFPQTKLLQKAQMILQCMTGNVNFPTPTPDLTSLGTAIGDFSQALANPISKANTALKNQLRAVLIALLNQLALYVQMNCNNDETVALSSGYTLSKTKQPFGVLAKASNFKALPLHNCMIKLSNKKIDGADSYSYEYTPAPVVDQHMDDCKQHKSEYGNFKFKQRQSICVSCSRYWCKPNYDL